MSKAAANLYRTISMNDKYSSVRFIANVIMTGMGKPASRLKGLIRLVDSGREVSHAQFMMPYECIVVDGRHVVATPALDRGELVEYTKDWYKHN